MAHRDLGTTATVESIAEQTTLDTIVRLSQRQRSAHHDHRRQVGRAQPPGWGTVAGDPGGSFNGRPPDFGSGCWRFESSPASEQHLALTGRQPVRRLPVTLALPSGP